MSLTLRITGGTRRGRKLLSPPKNSLRPASDMIRQAVFNMLGVLVEDCDFVDVFAGTGIVGLEALSRGARRAIFVERDRATIDLLRKNGERAGFTGQMSVRPSDALTWAAHFQPGDNRTVVFLGPPYPDFNTIRPNLWEMVVNLQNTLRDGDVLVLQFPSAVPTSELPDLDRWWRLRRYGKTHVGIWMTKPPVRDELLGESSSEPSGNEEEEPIDHQEDEDGETGASEHDPSA